MEKWFLENVIGILGILVGGFIGYHVYFLSRKINLSDRLTKKENIRKEVIPILSRIAPGETKDIEIVNVKKYLKYYPFSNKLTRHGYTYLRAEIKDLVFNGLEVFCGVEELYKNNNDEFSLKEKVGFKKENNNALKVGLIPFEWIDFIDSSGDEFSNKPQFFIKFKGKKNLPYKYYSFYINKESFDKNTEPRSFQWKKIEVIQ